MQTLNSCLSPPTSLTHFLVQAGFLWLWILEKYCLSGERYHLQCVFLYSIIKQSSKRKFSVSSSQLNYNYFTALVIHCKSWETTAYLNFVFYAHVLSDITTYWTWPHPPWMRSSIYGFAYFGLRSVSISCLFACSLYIFFT